KRKYSYAWNYAREEVREHKLALFEEWLRYDIDGVELDFQRSPCLFSPGKEAAGMPLLTDFVEKVNVAVGLASSRLGRDLTVATRVPPSIERCRAAGIDIEAWMRRGLVDVVTPMDRGYFDPEPQLREFIAIANPRGIKVLGGIEPNVRGYESTNRQVYAAVSNFQLQGVDGAYLFNYDCHRRAGGRAPNGHWKSYTDEEVAFLRSALDPAVVRAHDKQYLVSHCTYRRVAEEGGTRPLKCRFPIGEPRAFQITVGDDVEQAERAGRLQSSTLVVVLTDCQLKPSDLNLIVNGQKVETWQIGTTQKDGGVELRLDSPPIRQGANTVSLMRTKGGSDVGLIESMDLNLYYRH
ncbi:MAG: hypothetical protein MK538_12595, partial [Planctomycetes bacterium]|nr:hypothetical protein [Planctomycetota bacterium]